MSTTSLFLTVYPVTASPFQTSHLWWSADLKKHCTSNYFNIETDIYIYIYIYTHYIDTSVLLENIPLVTFIKMKKFNILSIYNIYIFTNYWMRLSRIWGIPQIKEGVIHPGRRPRWIIFSEICRILISYESRIQYCFTIESNKNKLKHANFGQC